ncbi:hypothetical protein BG261_09470 [Floricoccus tropicus]|uniref:Uncharacterized protein n=1 Tax=Floricoccus tropicus TaxID=1859473 RepID=A0A1E8GRS7_9LACT|nr:hypothetical protein [Floricoccus tropicus]OFI50188.1 hypothetical protein BG261_09470 [Floricoccus tropicus]
MIWYLFDLNKLKSDSDVKELFFKKILFINIIEYMVLTIILTVSVNLLFHSILISILVCSICIIFAVKGTARDIKYYSNSRNLKKARIELLDERNLQIVRIAFTKLEVINYLGLIIITGLGILTNNIDLLLMSVIILSLINGIYISLPFTEEKDF